MFATPIAFTDPVVASRPTSRLRLSILGVTGSIGRQTVDLVLRHPDRFEVGAVSVNRRVDDALDICRRLKPRFLVVCDTGAASVATSRMADFSPGTRVLVGAEHLDTVASLPEIDMVVTATVGFSGFRPTVAALRAGKDIALANKETLVVGGEIVRSLMADSKSRIFPVDSEHSAIAQCLRGEDIRTVERLLVTASGGAFRDCDTARLPFVTAADALKHPNWNMGAKITIDSATMMNKAFEIVEAYYLFGVPADRIEAVIHPQSIVHSMVRFDDGSLKAQLGVPDMHLPIGYALGLNNRMAGVERPLSLEEMSTLTFHAPDSTKFPCLGLANVALERKGNVPCVINAANEIAVEAFLNGQIRFTDIYPVIVSTIEKVDYIAGPSIDDLLATDSLSRIVARESIKRMLHN